jgi:hypothetical protein
VAEVVWRALGWDVPNYVEPFCGSLAVLLGRPRGPGKIETVNDASRWIANFWRAVTAEPEAVAGWADWPVNEADMHARHWWLVSQEEFRERMHVDPDYYDVKVAGWWVWGQCMWIGGGWCAEPNNRKVPKLDGIGKGVHSGAGHRKLPHLAVKADGACAGRGIHSDAAVEDQSGGRRRPHLSNGGLGVHSDSTRPQCGWTERPQLNRRPDMTNLHGVHLPSLGNDRGLHGVSAAPCVEWFLRLQQRLRRVRVACGDWSRVLGPSVLGKGKNVGGRRPCAVFLDPGYSHELRAVGLYTEDDAGVAAAAAEWAREHGDDPDLRIALCGYEGEHEMPASWTVHAWKSSRGYAGADNSNRTKERIWFSPFCLPLEAQRNLFELG